MVAMQSKCQFRHRGLDVPNSWVSKNLSSVLMWKWLGGLLWIAVAYLKAQLHCIFLPSLISALAVELSLCAGRACSTLCQDSLVLVSPYQQCQNAWAQLSLSELPQLDTISFLVLAIVSAVAWITLSQDSKWVILSTLKFFSQPGLLCYTSRCCLEILAVPATSQWRNWPYSPVFQLDWWGPRIQLTLQTMEAANQTVYIRVWGFLAARFCTWS